MTKPIRGKIQNVVTLEKVLAQFCQEIIRDALMNAPINIAKKHFTRKVIDIPEKIRSINLSIMEKNN